MWNHNEGRRCRPAVDEEEEGGAFINLKLFQLSFGARCSPANF